jgi:hypothetical protein
MKKTNVSGVYPSSASVGLGQDFREEESEELRKKEKGHRGGEFIRRKESER